MQHHPLTPTIQSVPPTRFPLSLHTAVLLACAEELWDVANGGEGGREHERDDGGELDEDVERRAAGVLERVAHGVAHHGRLVHVAALALALEGLRLDVLLGVVPRAARVGSRDGHLHAAHQRAGQHARQRRGPEQVAGDERGEHDQRARRDHHAQRRLGGDGHAGGVVGAEVGEVLLAALVQRHGVELAAHLLHHGQRCLAHALHGHGREPVRQHGAHQQAGEDVRVEDVHGGQAHHRHVGAEQGQRHQGRGADGEALADGGRGVAGGVQRVRDVAHLVGHAAHLGQAAGVVADGAVGVDGEGAGGGGGLDEPARTLKRPRLVWTPQLHKRFVDAVAHLGIKNAVPKTIMQLMSVDGLTRENVASHLQKYRLYLKRMQGISSNGSGGVGGSNVSVDPTDHLFASSPVPAHFLHPGRPNSDHFLPFMPVAAMQQQHQMAAVVGPGPGPAPHHHQQLQQQFRQFGTSPPNGQFEHPFIRQSQQQVQRMGAPVHISNGSVAPPLYVEDSESPRAGNGRKVLTLFPTGDD